MCSKVHTFLKVPYFITITSDLSFDGSATLVQLNTFSSSPTINIVHTNVNSSSICPLPSAAPKNTTHNGQQHHASLTAINRERHLPAITSVPSNVSQLRTMMRNTSIRHPSTYTQQQVNYRTCGNCKPWCKTQAFGTPNELRK